MSWLRNYTRPAANLWYGFFHTEKAVNGERLDFSKMSSVVSRTGRGRRKSERFILLVIFPEYFFSFPIHWKWFYLCLTYALGLLLKNSLGASGSAGIGRISYQLTAGFQACMRESRLSPLCLLALVLPRSFCGVLFSQANFSRRPRSKT